MIINSFNAGIFGTTHSISLECLREPTAQYIIVHKSDEGRSLFTVFLLSTSFSRDFEHLNNCRDFEDLIKILKYLSYKHPQLATKQYDLQL